MDSKTPTQIQLTPPRLRVTPHLRADALRRELPMLRNRVLRLRLPLLTLALVILPLVILPQCGLLDDGPQVKKDDHTEHLTHEKLLAHCWNTVPGAQLYAFDDNPQNLLMYFRPAGLGVVSSANGGLLSRDGGHLWQKLTGSIGEGANTSPAPLQGVNHPLVLHDNFWIAQARFRSSGTFEQPAATMVLDIVVDGVNHGIDAVPSTQKLGEGLQASLLWKVDAQRQVALSQGFLYVTEDKGATWKRLGAAAVWRPTFTQWNLIAQKNDLALWFALQEDASTWLVKAGQQPKQVVWHNEMGQQINVFQMGIWGEKLVAYTGKSVLVSADLGATSTQLEVAENGPGIHFLDDAQGNLWGFPEGGAPDPAKRGYIYRWAPGETKPTVIDVDAGALEIDGIASAIPRQNGAWQLLVLSPGTHRETRGSLVCDAGPTQKPGFDPVVTEPIQAALSGRVITAERFDDGSEMLERLAISPFGRIYNVSDFGRISDGPKDRPPLHRFGEVDAIDPTNPRQPSALFHATEASVEAAFTIQNSPLISPPPNWLAVLNRLGGKAISQVDVPVVSDAGVQKDIFQVREWGGMQFLQMSRGTWRRDKMLPGENAAPPPHWPNEVVVNAHFGAFVGGLDLLSQDAKALEFVVRFDPNSQPAPDGKDCKTLNPPPPSCIPLVDVAPVDADFDADGNLYVLDNNRGRVLMLPKDGNAWMDVATGFISPSDFVLRHLGDKVVLVVNDGDAFAFTVEPGKVKVRGADLPPPLSYAPSPGNFTRLDCAEKGGPCLSENAKFIVDASSGNACISGTSLGTESGIVELAGKNAVIQSWSDTSVCFSVPEDVGEGLLRLIRHDGQRSNRLAYALKAQVSSEAPAEMKADAVLRVTGKHLGAVTITGAHVVAQGETFADLMPLAGSNSVVFTSVNGQQTVQSWNVKPVVKRACRGQPGDVCELLGLGFGAGSTVQSANQTLKLTVEVAGKQIVPHVWTDSLIRLYLPQDLPPGEHTLTLQRPEFTLPVTVTIDPQMPEVLATNAPAPVMFSWLHSRPVRVGTDLLVPFEMWQWGTIAGMETPSAEFAGAVLTGSERKDGFAPLHQAPLTVAVSGEGGQPLRLAPWQGNVLAASRDKVQPSRVTVTQVAVKQQPFPAPVAVNKVLGTLQGPPHMRLSAMDALHGRLVAVMQDTFDPTTTLVDFLPNDTSLTTGKPVVVPFSTAVSGGNSSGADIGPDGVYLSTCRMGNDAKVIFIPATGDSSGLTFGAPQVVFDAKGTSIIACNVGPSGFWWVQRSGSSSEILYHHTLKEGTLPIKPLPLTLPGVGKNATLSADQGVAGLRDLLELPGGDVLLLMDDEAEPRGLRLVRLKTDGTLVQGTQRVLPSTLVLPGELCLGPSNEVDCPGQLGQHGCAPLACPLTPWQTVTRALDHFGEASLVPGLTATTVDVIYEASTTLRPPGVNFGGTDVHHVTLQVPL